MEIYLHYQPLVGRFTSLTAGVLFTYLSITIIGYGAAVAIPENLLLPLMQFSPTFALSLTEFFTIGIPLAVSFYLLALIFRRLVKMVYSYLHVAPFILFMLYGLVTIGYNNENIWYYFSLTVAKLLPILACAIFLAKQDASNNET